MSASMLAALVPALLGALAGPAREAPAPAPGRGGHQQLQGFQTVLVSQINAVLGTENLPAATGMPVEPGVYVTLAASRTLIFDQVAATITNGQYADPTIAADCVSKCPRVIFDAFYFSWRALAAEAQGLGIDVPSRVLFAADRNLPAKVLIQTAYAAAETRAGPVPNLVLLLNGGQAGVRARPFSLLPPGGLRIGARQRVLGLTVRVEADGRYRVSAADPGFARTLDADTRTIAATLADIKKNYPGKETIVIEAGDAATVGDLVALMVVAQAHFARVVLSGGQRVSVG